MKENEQFQRPSGCDQGHQYTEREGQKERDKREDG